MTQSAPRRTDTAHDVFRQERQPLDVIFKPRSIAVVGATETAGSVGRTLMTNLLSSPFGGTVYPVNPKRPAVLGVRAYKNIADLPEVPDLVVVVTPSKFVPGIIGEAADVGVRGAVVISAGFKEIGPEGVELERQVLAEARRGKMRLIGPNCLGVMNPLTGLNATFAKGIARPGNVAFISQSGALCTAILDWSFRENVGFSAFASTGSMLDVSWGDLVDYLGNDPRTKSILIYMESIGDARRFLSAAREVALNKPIIVIKPGRTEAAAKAAASHTGSLTGSDEVLEAAFRRVGVLRVSQVAELFYMAEVLAKQPLPKGNRMTVITNAGGPGVLATDALISTGGALTEVSDETMEKLNAFLPSAWSHANPIDVLGDAGAERYAKTLELAAEDHNSDGMLVILTPQDMTEATPTADALKKYASIEGKPVLASFMGGPEVEAGNDILSKAGIPTFPYPDTAARMFTYMYRYSYNLKGLYQTPAFTDEPGLKMKESRAAAEKMVEDVRQSGRNLMTEAESKELMKLYGIPVVETVYAESVEDAVKAAGAIGYPVVVKLNSETITHKTDVGGVRLNLHTADEVKVAFEAIRQRVTELHTAADFQGVTVQPMIKLSDGYEIILGASPDPQFGPVLLFGTGGQLVEVFKDRSLGLPPLNRTLAKRMMEQTKIYHALQGVRGRPPVDQELMENTLVRFSRLVAEQRFISEIDINPLFVSHERIVALDARVVLYDKSVTRDEILPPAIRPYPTKYVEDFKSNDEPFTIRPIRPEDEPLLVRFHETLSERSVRLRFFAPMQLGQRVAHERLMRRCFCDYAREMALIAEKGTGTEREMVAVGRLSKIPGLPEAEFSILVSDLHQNRGLGTKLLDMLVQVARDEKLERVSADILPENKEMQAVAKKSGFKLHWNEAGDEVKAEILL